MAVAGYGKNRLPILTHQFRSAGLRAEGGSYALEALNFVDGKRSVQAIRDALAAQFGPVPLGHVVEYLAALEAIGVLRR